MDNTWIYIGTMAVKAINPIEGKAMNTFYFNSGVKPENTNGLFGNQVWRGGVMQIPFSCDAPIDARFKFACNYNDLPESRLDNWLVCEIEQPNKCMLSKYAYFLKVTE